MRSDQEPVRMAEKRPPAVPGAADRLDDGEELNDKQQGDNVGQDGDLLGTAGEHLDHSVGDHGNTDSVADGAGDGL